MNENRSTHPKISLGILFIIIIFLFQTALFAANEPYLTVKNQNNDAIFTIPEIRVVRIESDKTIDVNFLDSCNAEKKFRLYRKSINGAWVVLDSQTNCSPDSMIWRVFHDKTPAANTLYSYKVQAYNSALSVFSPEATVYNYVQPDNNQKYTISLLSSIPANPVGWVECLGDSLFFPNGAPQGDIAIIDISKPQSPQLKSLFKQSEVPTNLKNSLIDARIKLHPGNVFFKSLKRCYFILTDSTLYQYDSLTQSFRDSIHFHIAVVDISKKRFNKGWFVGTIGDSCFLLGCKSGEYVVKNSTIYPIKFTMDDIDTLPTQIKWAESQVGARVCPSVYGGGSWGCFDKKVVISIFNFGPMNNKNYTYKLYDFTADITNPFLFTITDTISIFRSNDCFNVVDRKISLFCWLNNLQIFVISAIDISNAYNNCLGEYIDTTFKSSSILSTMVDTIKNLLIVSGNRGISIYSYSKSVVNINSQNNKTNHNSNKISVIQSFHGINFIHSFNQQMYLEIFDVKGRVIRQIVSLPYKPLFWDKRDINNRPVAPGVYFYKLNTKENTRYSGSLIITQ